MNKFQVLSTSLLLLIASCCSMGAASNTSNQRPATKVIMTNEPNPPLWPPAVKIFSPTDDPQDIAAQLEETQDGSYERDGDRHYTTEHHFSNRRWALLFAPGTYRGDNWKFQVGYYVQVAGLGVTPDHVRFEEGAGPFSVALNKHLHDHGSCLDTFWRAAEHFSTPTLRWAVSQAAPLRNVHVRGDLYLHDSKAYASGGHLANSVIDGHTYFGGQQQYMSRNVAFGKGISGGAWSLVFVGCAGELPESRVGTEDTASHTITSTPRVRLEKPFLSMYTDDMGTAKYELRIPQATRADHSGTGPTAFDSESDVEVRDFSRVRVVTPTEAEQEDYDGDATATRLIQEALDEGKDVVLAPGIFRLTQQLTMKRDNQVLLGLGLATLVAPKDGVSACIQVPSGLQGVRIAGIMLEASEKGFSYANAPTRDHPTSLLEWGEQGVIDAGSPSNPGGFFDVFCRVGGDHGPRDRVWVDNMMTIHSGNVVGDNIWLWRADHSSLAPGEEANCPQVSPIFHQNEEDESYVQTGIEVYGDDVTMYGLAVEHANGHQTVWNGERGEVHFYQCELPYDVSVDYGEAGYRGYLVGDNVEQHAVHGPGVYSNFRKAKVVVETAIRVPKRDGISVVNPFTVHLDNNGTIQSVVNGEGPAALKQGKPVRVTYS